MPGQDGDATLASLEALAAEFGAGVELVEMTEPFETPADSPLVVALAEATAAVAGEARDPIGVPAWTDAHNMVDFAGAEAVVYGPGDFAPRTCPRSTSTSTRWSSARRCSRPSPGGRRAGDPGLGHHRRDCLHRGLDLGRAERGGHLNPDSRRALRHHGVAEARDVDARGRAGGG